MPGVPYIYYGDEIGMHADLSLPSFEGGFQRTGSRTPMRWDSSKNAGFSMADRTFLPTNETDSTVEEELKDKDSLWNVIHSLINIRKESEDLRSDSFELLDQKLAYKRAETLVAINLLDEDMTFRVSPNPQIVFSLGDVSLKDNVLTLKKHAGVIVK